MNTRPAVGLVAEGLPDRLSGGPGGIAAASSVAAGRLGDALEDGDESLEDGDDEPLEDGGSLCGAAACASVEPPPSSRVTQKTDAAETGFAL